MDNQAFFQELLRLIDSISEQISSSIYKISDINLHNWIGNKENFNKISALLNESDVSQSDFRVFIHTIFIAFVHDMLVMLDGGTSLSDNHKIYLIDENGNQVNNGLPLDFFIFLDQIGRYDQ